MAPPPQGLGRDGPGNNHALGAESEAARLERESFARFVLDWHLRRGLKTALLDVGAAVPNILCEFLADWREAELLWMFQVCKRVIGIGCSFRWQILVRVVGRYVCLIGSMWLRDLCLSCGGASPGATKSSRVHKGTNHPGRMLESCEGHLRISHASLCFL